MKAPFRYVHATLQAGASAQETVLGDLVVLYEALLATYVPPEPELVLAVQGRPAPTHRSPPAHGLTAVPDMCVPRQISLATARQIASRAPHRPEATAWPVARIA